jgi:undecaprenyl-diphosphatase
MVDWLQTVTLALIQGLSEFLPISSSAHLILPSQVLGWPDQGLAFDIAVHVGTLIAVLGFYRRDLLGLLGDLMPSLRVDGASRGELWVLVVASMPAVCVGALAGHYVQLYLRGTAVIALTTLVFGVLLGWADLRSRIAREAPHSSERLQVSMRDGLLIGCAQALALIPGTSRSGITITAALLLGYRVDQAARFSFLLAVPVILGAMVFSAIDLRESTFATISALQLTVAVVVSATTAYLTIAAFTRWVQRIGLMPFAVYRVVLGLLLIFIGLQGYPES